MKFSCNQQSLSKALNIVQKAVTSRTTIPILKGILLKGLASKLHSPYRESYDLLPVKTLSQTKQP